MTRWRLGLTAMVAALSLGVAVASPSAPAVPTARAAAPQSGAAGDAGAAAPAPGEEIKAAALAELKVIEGRTLNFANEMPAAKYTWNPGVMLVPPAPNPQADPYGRTVADLFLHIANLNFTHGAQLSGVPADGFNPKDYETSTTDKTKVIGELAKSFTYAESALAKSARKR
jgi:hypothetical protein